MARMLIEARPNDHRMNTLPDRRLQQTILLCRVMFVLHALITVFLIAALVQRVLGPSPLRAAGSHAYQAGHQLGYQLAIPLLLVANGVGGLWSGLNARGLSRRSPWAYASSLAYWASLSLSCCGLPVGLYGLWSLTREGVAGLLGRGTRPA